MTAPTDVEVSLVRAALLGQREDVARLRAEHPELVAQSVHVAAALLERTALEALLADDADAGRAPGPRQLTPLLLACMTRVGSDAEAAATARLLISHGSEPDDGLSIFAAFDAGRAAVLEVLLDSGVDPSATSPRRGTSLLHHAADVSWRPELVERLLQRGADPNARAGPFDETVLYTAVRRRRLDAVELLLDFGADVAARTRGGDTPWRHAVRRPFPEVAARLAARGADASAAPVDELARALLAVDLEGASATLRAHPDVIARMVPEEARLLGDLASQGKVEAVRFLLDHGADIEARALDGGTPLQQCGWFGQPEVARLLVERGADVHATGCEHESTPLGWTTHGSRYSGGADERQEAYLAVAELLLDSGAALELPGDPPDRPGARMLAEASEAVAALLRERRG